MTSSRPSIFNEPTGTRWQRVRRVALAIGTLTSLLALGLAGAILVPPSVPQLNWRPFRSAVRHRAPELNATRAMRARASARERLLGALQERPSVPGVRPSQLVLHPATLPQHPPSPPAQSPPVTAGFYVSWDDNSLASLKANMTRLDWVICEWAFVAPGGDSVRIAIDPRALFVTQHAPEAARPRVFLMLTNVDSSGRSFRRSNVARMLREPVRTRAVESLVRAVEVNGLAGVVIDLEEVPGPARADYLAILAALHARMNAAHRLLAVTMAADAPARDLRDVSAVSDRVILMAYDEHDGQGDAGPVASTAWFAAQLSRAEAIVPASTLIAAIGAYGYDWNDAGADASGDEMTFQDAVTHARDNGQPIHFDARSGTPYLEWTDPDSTDHVGWFLDATANYAEITEARRANVAGVAIWRLGSEDPSLWRTLSRGMRLGAMSQLDTIPSGYDVQFDGRGEILRVASTPTLGVRTVDGDSATGRPRDERYVVLPSPFVVQRSGAQAHRVALTFDDGPDPTWTPRILDTLRAHHALATFFVIGENAEAHLALLRQAFAEGHEIGNHTFTHPNLALTSNFVTRLEIDATERLIEAVLDRRSAFFRPPYFGDAAPTTADELVPVGIASRLGFLTAGLEVDSDDWMRPGTAHIIQKVLTWRDSGSVVLLHDGGGDRSQTLRALGPLIDALHARGDTLVVLSQLLGVSRDQAMPALPRGSATARAFELAAFGALGGLEWLLSWFFLIAVVLGIGRVFVMTTMAYLQRFRAPSRDSSIDAGVTAPHVSVVVPAYNEQTVIVATIASLLKSDYDGMFDILVIDDGSPDETAAVAKAAFAMEERVTVLRKQNGGKASALNFGIARATGAIIIGLDADTVFRPETIARLVPPFADERVAAVAGNAKVGNRINLVTRFQALEYISSQNLDRRAFALLNCITVVPGAVGAWRKSAVLAVGGFGDDTLAEDQDLTIRLRRAGHRIAYVDDAIALTEAPDTLRGLAKQRYRWSYGTLQCAWKHRGALFRRRAGTLGWFALPSVWLFQLVFPALSPMADLLFLWSLLSLWLVKLQHGGTYAVTNARQLLALYAAFLLIDWIGAVLAFLLEREERLELTLLVALQRFVYRQVMYSVVVRSIVAALHGRLVGWGKLERKATVLQQD